MDIIHLPPDFKDFLQLLNVHKVEYLLIGGYAVGYYGYPRATADMDVWIAISPSNASKLVNVLTEFGFAMPRLSPQLFLQAGQIIRMGVPPLRLEILTTISGLEFEECYQPRTIDLIEGIEVNIITEQLKKNKKARGRHKDLNDLENLP
jgi:hypothetical protein